MQNARPEEPDPASAWFDARTDQPEGWTARVNAGPSC
jgi:hypothetical protein